MTEATERFALVRRDAEGRELSRVPLRYIPRGFTTHAWAEHVARVQTETLRALCGEGAGDWRAEREGGEP